VYPPASLTFYEVCVRGTVNGCALVRHMGPFLQKIQQTALVQSLSYFCLKFKCVRDKSCSSVVILRNMPQTATMERIGKGKVVPVLN
jgi:hypothetical protein